LHTCFCGILCGNSRRNSADRLRSRQLLRNCWGYKLHHCCCRRLCCGGWRNGANCMRRKLNHRQHGLYKRKQLPSHSRLLQGG
jgi:hypothetical protein